MQVCLVSQQPKFKELRTIPTPPKRLYIKGSLDGYNYLDSVAIVGTRHPSKIGIFLAELTAAMCVKAGLTIVSGFAQSIDTVAHKTALEHGGKTIAVMPCGLDKVYPYSNRSLLNDLIESDQGIFVSEYEPDTEPEPGYFVSRNRLISGLSVATIVIECSTSKSGTMHTARFAVDQSRLLACWSDNLIITEGNQAVLRLRPKLNSATGTFNINNFLSLETLIDVIKGEIG